MKENETTNQSMEQSAPVFSAFVTNLGKYNEGELVGKWVSFPTTNEEMQNTFKEIGIDGKNYEEYFITDYDCSSISGLYDKLPEYPNLSELNYLANKISEIPDYQMECYQAAIEYGDYASDIPELINLTDNLDCYEYLHGVRDDSDLGYYYIEEAGIYDLSSMGNLSNYIDYERFGRDIAIEQGGTYTDNGYICDTGDSFTEYYSGIEDIPDEYRITFEPEQHEPEKIIVLLVEPKKEAKIIEIDNTLEAKQALVGGNIEAIYPYVEPVAIICNNEGKINGLDLNRAIYDESGKMQDIIAGTMLVTGLSKNNFASLSPELMDKFKEQFKLPEQFMKIDGELVALKIPELKPKDKNENTKPTQPNKAKGNDKER